MSRKGMGKKETLNELINANKEVADELVVANKENAAELVIAKVEKTKRAVELINAKIEKAKHAAELVIANKELMLANKQEKLAKEKYIELYNFAPTGYFTLSREGKIIELNLFASQILGKEHSFLKDRWFGNFVSDSTKSIFNHFLEKVFKSKTKQICDVTLLTDSGLPKYVYLSGIVTKNAEQCLVSIDDISERKNVENALHESEEKYSKAFLSSPYSIAILSAEDGKFIEVNDAFTSISGFTREEALNNSAVGLNMWIDKEEQKRVMSTLLDGKDVAGKEFLFRKKNGEIITGLFSAKIIKLNNKLCVISSINDITERKKTEKNLRESEEKFHKLFNNSEVGMFRTRLDGSEILEFNQMYLKILNYTSEEIIGSPSMNLWAKKQEREKMVQLLKTEGQVTDFECELLTKQSDVINCITSLHLYPDSGILEGSILDITKRKQAELELIKAKEKAEESDRLKSAFLTNMSHEIRTPMNGILGFAELLNEPNLTSDEQQDYIQTIQISGARMLNTINNIVDVSKIESGLTKVDIKETDINEKIEFTYKFFKPEVEIKGLQFLFKNSLPTKEAIIKTDNEKVYAILTNLVKNAIKFTYEGSIEFGYEKKGEYLEFFVKDTGVGIPKNQTELIFERFRQGSESHDRGYEGSGLGLSIAKSYVTMLGGEIWVESEEGIGSTFYFTIPYNVVSSEKIELINSVSAEHKEVEIKNLKILIVEDDEISYSLLTRTLQKISYKVLHAITGVEAVEACRNNPDLDLVLMDIRMPVMDGNEATRLIRQFNRDIIIIAQTAYAFPGDCEKAIEAGCNDYISKPINKALLYELIKKHVNK